MTSLSSPIFASDFLLKLRKSFLSAIICMALDPMSRKMTMKKVAGFQSLRLADFAGTVLLLGSLKVFGTIDCHMEGCKARGNVPRVVEYVLGSLRNKMLLDCEA